MPLSPEDKEFHEIMDEVFPRVKSLEEAFLWFALNTDYMLYPQYRDSLRINWEFYEEGKTRDAFRRGTLSPFRL